MNRRQKDRRALASDNWDIFMPAAVRAGILRPIQPTTNTGYKAYGIGRLFLPAATNLVPDPQGTLADGTFWPADTAHTNTTANTAAPVAVPAALAGLTKCLTLVNDGTADTPETAVLAVSASKDYYVSFYVYAPIVGGNLVVTTQATGATTVATITAANTGWVRYSAKHTTAVGETELHLHFAFAGGTASTVYVTGAQVVQESVLTPFFCGASDLGGSMAWTGAANASTSTLTASSLTYSLTSGAFDTVLTTAGRFSSLWAANGAAGAYPCLWTVKGVGSTALSRFILNQQVPERLSQDAWDGVSNPTVNSAALSFAAGTVHSAVLRRTATKLDLTLDGIASAQTNNTCGAQVATTLIVGASYALEKIGTAYVGPLCLAPFDIGASDTVAVDAMLTAGATGVDLVRFFRDRGYVNTLVIPFAGDGVGYTVVT